LPKLRAKPARRHLCEKRLCGEGWRELVSISREIIEVTVAIQQQRPRYEKGTVFARGPKAQIPLCFLF
jgi:hypothetical protein